jgi:predicted Zn-dependent protease
LAAVLGHETAHVAALHSVSALQRQMGVSVLASLATEVLTGSAGEAAKIGAEVAGAMVNLKYSRGDEYEADTFGVRYMTKAGYNPHGMVELLTTLYNLNDSEGGGLGEMFATHPLPSKRIDEAKAYIAEKYPGPSPAGKDPNAGRFLEMQDRMTRKLGWSK